jgi:hypothetical protein
MPLSQELDRAEAFHSLSLCRTSVGGGWQANLQVEQGGGWRVCHGATPSEALGALFAPVPAPCLPALPY